MPYKHGTSNKGEKKKGIGVNKNIVVITHV